jgi:hypothetical protein
MPASHFMVIYVNPILQDCKQALILLALIFVFLYFRYCYCSAGKKFYSALLRTTVEVEFVVLLLGASQLSWRLLYIILLFIALLYTATVFGQ